MPRIKVIGVGPGAPEYLTPAAKSALAAANIVVGGKRHLDCLARTDQKTFVIKNNLTAAVEFIRLHRQHGVAVLASGDPGLYGILGYLRRYFPPEEFEVIPGISSVQLAFARLAMPWHDAIVLSAHGRDMASLVNTILSHAKVALLTGPGNPPDGIARQLLEGGMKNRKIYCCCHLGYPEEEILVDTPDNLADRDFSGTSNCVMVILDETKLELCDARDS